METYEKLENEINEIIEQVETYNKSDEGNYGEFVSSFYYGDADPTDVRRKLSEILGDYDYLLETITDRELFETIGPFCNVQFGNIYCPDNYILSCILGEIEEELPDQIKDQLEIMTEEERKKLRIDAFLKDSYIYIDMNYDVCYLIFDKDDFLEGVGK